MRRIRCFFFFFIFTTFDSLVLLVTTGIKQPQNPKRIMSVRSPGGKRLITPTAALFASPPEWVNVFCEVMTSVPAYLVCFPSFYFIIIKPPSSSLFPLSLRHPNPGICFLKYSGRIVYIFSLSLPFLHFYSLRHHVPCAPPLNIRTHVPRPQYINPNLFFSNQHPLSTSSGV